jgi:hypothetical protein
MHCKVGASDYLRDLVSAGDIFLLCMDQSGRHIVYAKELVPRWT